MRTSITARALYIGTIIQMYLRVKITTIMTLTIVYLGMHSTINSYPRCAKAPGAARRQLLQPKCTSACLCDNLEVRTSRVLASHGLFNKMQPKLASFLS